MAQKPSIPKGTRDFSPGEVAKRNYIFETIRKQFEVFGFAPIETPSFENLETLMGKYGDEGDRLIFNILNSGDYLQKVDDHTLTDRDVSGLTPKISEKALRYDLTVPFARYVVMHQNEIDFPFKRYQIQPVWRADRPQKGRFREFYQCDADVVGPSSLFQEIELIQLYDAVFSELGLSQIRIKLNHRKILSGIAEVIGASDKLIPFTVALDKLDKIGEEGVIREMAENGISEAAIQKAMPLFTMNESTDHPLHILSDYLKDSQIGKEGIADLTFISENIEKLGLKCSSLELDVSLARGLNYYTGAIIEVAAPEKVNMGSIGGGGRYDDLTGIFGLKDLSGVGISFGLDRIYLVLDELGLFPDAVAESVKVMFANFGEREALAALPLIRTLRKEGINTDLYPTDTKLQKQLKYANNRKIPYVVLLGKDELEQNTVVIKDMARGSQETYPWKDLQNFIDSL